RLTIWNTQRGLASVSSRWGGGFSSDLTSGSNGGPGGGAAASPCAPCFVRAYCQLLGSYLPRKPLYGQSASCSLYSRSPEKTPLLSSVSLKSSLTMVAALV